MIEQLVTFALKNRFLVLASVIMLLCGAGSRSTTSLSTPIPTLRITT